LTARLLARLFLASTAGLHVSSLLADEPAKAPAVCVFQGNDGHLVYGSDALGNRVIDYSHAGYEGGGEAIPLVPARVVLGPRGRNDGERIQAALDVVASLPAGADGFRGAILLRAGRYLIEERLLLGTSGVVLRGSGDGEDGTVLVAVGQSRRTLIEVCGNGDRVETDGARRKVADHYVPVGATLFKLETTSGLMVGMRVVIRRPSTVDWIASLGMNLFSGWRPEERIQWGPGSRDVEWERTILGIAGNAIVVDAPITTALEAGFGGGTVTPCRFSGRIDHVGIENMRFISEFDRTVPEDEEHAWDCISLSKVENAWVRKVTAQHFVDHVINAKIDSRSVTIEDCTAVEPVSELAAYRRCVFSIGGELTLVQRCRSDQGLHDFTTGFTAPGPNVFLRCTATGALDWSGTSESWASGILYDNVVVRGNALRLSNRGASDQGAGWTAANSILWNCESTELQVQSPPGALNQEFGCKDLVVDDSLVYNPRSMPYTDPHSMPYRDFFKGYATTPHSLYYAQLAERKGAAALSRIEVSTIAASGDGARELADADLPAQPADVVNHPLKVERARFVIDGEEAWTEAKDWTWYLGQMAPGLARPMGPAITRFAPGETGVGLTDDLKEVIASLPKGSVFVQHYGLWYDRRRINHDFYGSPELPANDVTPPFMEMPWGRSGQGSDWDGMSKYDLTRYNPWYFQRVKDYATLCDNDGRVLFFNFYFQHALEEVRAHYVDFPWRPVNCLQATGLPDENPAGSTFYDFSNPVRRDLHQRYIRHCLDVLKGRTNVVYGLDPEFTGPLSFVEFWLDTIADWEKANGQKVFIALQVPKTEMDALLVDQRRAPMITAIDFHGWFYRADGSLYAAKGGIDKTLRGQWIDVFSEADLQALRRRVSDPAYQGTNVIGSPEGMKMMQDIRLSSPAMRYRAWREYRDQYPGLVLLVHGDEFPGLTEAIERDIPDDVRASMHPVDSVRTERSTTWAMAAAGRSCLIYSIAGQAAEIDLTSEHGTFHTQWIGAGTAGAGVPGQPVEGGGRVELRPPAVLLGQPWAAFLTLRP
jgi:hypothetical protein